MDSFNKEVAKILSLMERMEGKMTPYEAMLNEERMINEALSSDRELITADNFFDFKTSMRNGGFASIGYVTGANLNLPEIKMKNPNTGRMKGYVDTDTIGKNFKYSGDSIGGIIKLTKYRINWNTADSMSKKYLKYKQDYNALCDEYGCHDNKIKDGGKYKTNSITYGDDSVKVYDGNNEELRGHEYTDQNTHGAVISSKYYLIDISGSIVRELGKEELKDYFKEKNSSSRVIKALRDMGTDEAKIQEFINRTKDLKMSYKRFEANYILYCVGAYKDDNGKLQKAIFINDNLTDTIKDDKFYSSINGIKFKPWELRRIEEENRKIDMQDVVNAVESSK